jgi:hypothetical protein
MAEEVKKDEDWMQKKWRPAMGWMYMLVCMMDMVVFPIAWSLLQALTHTSITQWNPLTLQGAGLFHIAMGAVLGIAAFGRTQEKIAGSATNVTPSNTPTPTPSFGAGMPTAPSPTPSAGFGSNNFSSPTPATAGGFGGAGVPTPAVVNSGAGTGFNFGSGLHPDDPPTRNTRND